MIDVVVVGGGHGGVAVARELDRDTSVTLVEPKDAFVHNVAALRGLVDTGWAEAMFLPYDRLLTRGHLLRDRAVEVSADAGGVTVGTARGERLRSDYAVLATGSSYPFPAKIDSDAGADGRERLRSARVALAACASVLIVGAGPTGLELAGEIRALRPDVTITVLGRSPEILPGPLPEEFRDEVRRQLEELRVELVLGDALVAEPAVEPGVGGAVTVRTTGGRRIDADAWYRCHGTRPVGDYLRGALAAARRADGSVEVTEELLLPGQRRVFAIGDVTSVDEPKMAKAAEQHAAIVAANIRTLAEGAGELDRYCPGPPGISLPLGPRAGASYSTATGVLGAERTAELKGAALRLDLYRSALGLDPVGSGARKNR